MSHTQRHPIYTHLQVAHYRQARYNSEHNSEDRLSALLFSRIKFYQGSSIIRTTPCGGLVVHV